MGFKISPELESKILAMPGVVVSGPGAPQDVKEDEKSFQSRVIALAKRNGWRGIYHTHDSRKSQKGFPDLVLTRERVIFIECKSDDGELTADQLNWRDWLLAAKAEWYCLRPRDWAEIERILA